MLNDPAELAALIADTVLADHSILALDIPESDQKALAIGIELDQDLAAWQLMHSYGEQTQRYPVITTLWGADAGNWEQEIKGADLFSRFYYQEEAEAMGHQAIAPAEIIARVAAVELEPLLSQESDLDDQAWEQYTLAPYTLDAAGIAPRHQAQALLHLDRWFLHERP